MHQVAHRHPMVLCPKTATTPPVPFPVHGGEHVSQPGDQLNESVCSYNNCRFSHICSICKDPHPKSTCPRRQRPREGPSLQEISKMSSTPINIPSLSTFLSSHPDPCFVDHLITGLSQGFRVGVLSPLSTRYVAENLQSAQTEPEIVSALLAKEVYKK